jgi:hypothetical protein
MSDTETRKRPSPMKWRYVEVSYELPEKGTTQFFATVGEHESPNVALLTAINMCKAKHPDAVNIEEFMQRVVTEEKAEKIMEKFNNNTWDGWDFKTEGSNL